LANYREKPNFAKKELFLALVLTWPIVSKYWSWNTWPDFNSGKFTKSDLIKKKENCCPVVECH